MIQHRKAHKFTSSSLLFLFIFVSCSQTQLINSNRLVDISTVNPRIILDIRYATQNNFLNRPVYSSPRCFVLESVALKLDSIQQDLESRGLGLKIFDGYRPYGVTKLMWEILPDERYVANPKNGSRHNRGAAVDLTLVDSSGNELDMPTGFDDFTDKAAHSYMNLSQKVINNRDMLRSIMENYGLTAIKSEWWHYDLKDYSDFPILDYRFEQIDSLNNQ